MSELTTLRTVVTYFLPLSDYFLVSPLSLQSLPVFHPQTTTQSRHSSSSYIYMDSIETEYLVSGLTDLELAVLLSLVAHQHCLIQTTEECVEDVAKELALVLFTLCFWMIWIFWLINRPIDLSRHI
jgi:hypothetical protein